MTSTPATFAGLGSWLAQAVDDGVFPAATADVGRSSGSVWRAAVGWTDDDRTQPAEVDTWFDLASLTKVIVTTSLAMRAIDTGQLSLDTRVADRLPRWAGRDRDDVTLSDLLAHASGLSAYLPLFRDHVGRVEFESTICQLPLEFTPRSQSIYSDLGFMLLGFILEDTASARLDEAFAALAAECGLDGLAFVPPHTSTGGIAPTGIDPWRGRVLRGEVHDTNAWALGGVAGHAGLFGTAPTVAGFARLLLATARGSGWDGAPLTHRERLARFFARVPIPGSSRALGWDTMLPTSSCGPTMGPTAIGHTGFTGTSIWIDVEADAYFVLLSNRVHAGDSNERILAARPEFHRQAIEALAGGA